MARPLSSTRIQVDELPAFDLPWLRRRGGLKPGTSGAILFSHGGSLRSNDTIQLNYWIERHRVVVRVGAALTFIHTTTSETPFGGRRLWFVCPGCMERRSVLRVRGQKLRCRQCLRGVYSSQYEPRGITICHRRAALRARLRRIDRTYPPLTPDIPLTVRPKGMWTKTWRGVVQRDRQLNVAFNAAVRARFGVTANDALDLWDEDDYAP